MYHYVLCVSWSPDIWFSFYKMHRMFSIYRLSNVQHTLANVFDSTTICSECFITNRIDILTPQEPWRIPWLGMLYFEVLVKLSCSPYSSLKWNFKWKSTVLGVIFWLCECSLSFSRLGLVSDTSFNVIRIFITWHVKAVFWGAWVFGGISDCRVLNFPKVVVNFLDLLS